MRASVPTRILVLAAACLVALSSWLAAPSTADAQRLRRASSSVRGRSSPSRPAPSSQRSAGRRDVRVSPPAPRARASTGRWAALVVRGPYVRAAARAPRDGEPPVMPIFRIAIAGEGQYALGNIGRGALALRVGLPVPLELHAAYGVYVEPLAGGGSEMIGLGRLGLAWRVAEDDTLHARIGAALRHFHDWQGGVAGLELFGGLDALLLEPMVISFEAGAAIVGESWVLTARSTFGLVAGPVEIYAGWEHVAFIPTRAPLRDGAWLSGPLLGLRAWL